MSEIQGRDFPPRPLPLRGPDYRMRVDREGTLRDYEITKRGDTITLDHPNMGRDVTIRVAEDCIDIRGFLRKQDILLRKEDGRVTVNRDSGSQITVLEKEGDRISVRRRDPSRDVTFVRNGADLLIDRYGVQNDVFLKSRGAVLYIDKPGTSNDVAVAFDGLEMDPVVFRQDTTLDPLAYDLLNRWFDRGVQMDDLVQVTQDGKVEVLDWLFA